MPDFLLDGAEHRLAAQPLHLDAEGVAEAHVGRPGRAVLEGLHGVVDVSIGKPIPSVGRESKDLTREAQEWIEAEMRRLDPDAYRP